jgi:hypothetical protein
MPCHVVSDCQSGPSSNIEGAARSQVFFPQNYMGTRACLRTTRKTLSRHLTGSENTHMRICATALSASTGQTQNVLMPRVMATSPPLAISLPQLASTTAALPCLTTPPRHRTLAGAHPHVEPPIHTHPASFAHHTTHDGEVV